VTLHEKRVPATPLKARGGVDISRADDLLAQARAVLLRADRSSDLRTALLAVREALDITTRLSETLRQIAAAQDPTREAQRREDRFSRPARGFRGG
jgi:hypothetical protein